ncbi:hypothetical protein BD311DRAFT_732643 [Dichomitus squalens]|uniref:Cytochrome P450 n=1 Tax=Dichomitus squalens TaxID=114155 RepID=A0A4Q9M6J9_9APHY|nr:hypothetical protein BD311DRAFT_732643 [Dichomitus squalens]
MIPLTRVRAFRSILHDQTMYPEPEIFNPERFLRDDGLDPDILDPQDVPFGFGRRNYPGRYVAYDTIWTAIATTLMCTEIGLAKDSAVKEIPIEEDYVSAFVTEPRPFPCHVRYRSDRDAGCHSFNGMCMGTIAFWIGTIIDQHTKSTRCATSDS